MQAERPCPIIAIGQWSWHSTFLRGGEHMKLLQTGSALAATTIMTIFPLGQSLMATAAEYSLERPAAYPGSSVVINHSSPNDSTRVPAEQADNYISVKTKSEDYPLRGQPDLSYLAFYPYAELPPARKPADVVLDSLSEVPIGTPLEEIKRASDAFALDFDFMKTVAKIESDFNPKQRTGSYRLISAEQK
jgi:hypothetical protein